MLDFEQELSQDNVVRRQQPNLNSNFQKVCKKSKVNVSVHRRQPNSETIAVTTDLKFIKNVQITHNSVVALNVMWCE